MKLNKETQKYLMEIAESTKRSMGFCTCERKHPKCPVCAWNDGIQEFVNKLSDNIKNENDMDKLDRWEKDFNNGKWEGNSEKTSL